VFVSYRLDISLLSAYLGSYRNAGQQRYVEAGGMLNEKMKAVVGSPNFFRNSARSSQRPKTSWKGYGAAFSNSPPRQRRTSRGTAYSSEKTHNKSSSSSGVVDVDVGVAETAVSPLHVPLGNGVH
jgi:hypothetical protein